MVLHIHHPLVFAFPFPSKKKIVVSIKEGSQTRGVMIFWGGEDSMTNR